LFFSCFFAGEIDHHFGRKNMKNRVVHFVENFLRIPLIYSNICVTLTHLASNPTHPHLVFAAKVGKISLFLDSVTCTRFLASLRCVRNDDRATGEKRSGAAKGTAQIARIFCRALLKPRYACHSEGA